MPDLNIEYHWACENSCEYEVDTPASDGKTTYKTTLSRHNPGEYQVNWHCTCPGFKFKRTCKHIKEGEGKLCPIDGIVSYYTKKPKDGKCKVCGGELFVMKVGV